MKAFIHVKRGTDGRTAYVSLPGYRSIAGEVSKTISLDDILENYDGPRVHLDFRQDGKLIGIEILVSIKEAPPPERM